MLRCDLWAKVKGRGICSQAALQEETLAAWQFWDGVSVQKTCCVHIYLYELWDRQEGHTSDGDTLADYPVYRALWLCHIRVLEREGTATPLV